MLESIVVIVAAVLLMLAALSALQNRSAKQRHFQRAFTSPDPQHRADAIHAMCAEGLTRHAGKLVRVVATEDDPFVLDSLVAAIFLRQWEPGSDERVAELREFALERAAENEDLAHRLPPALSRQGDLGGPREIAWMKSRVAKPDTSFVARSAAQLWDDLGRAPLTVVGEGFLMTVQHADSDDLAAPVGCRGALVVTGRRGQDTYAIRMFGITADSQIGTETELEMEEAT